MDSKSFLKKINLSNELVERIYGQNEINQLKNLDKIYFFTGRGCTSGTLHLGHYLLYSKLAELSHNYPVVFQLSGDEKRTNPEKYISLKKAKQYGDLFMFKLEHLFSWGSKLSVIDNLNPLMQTVLYNCANYICKHVKLKTIANAFGNTDAFFPFYLAVQLAPILLYETDKKKDQAVIITSQDQKAFFLIFRDIAHKLGHNKPIIVVIKQLKNIIMKEKMSSSALKYAVVVEPFSQFEKATKAVSAPFKNESPDLENDFIAHLINMLIEFDVNKADAKKIFDDYCLNKSTAKTKHAVIELLKKLSNKSESKKLPYFHESFNVRSNEKEVFELLNKYESSYLKH